MTVFLDTSALYAVLVRDDANHAPAVQAWQRLLSDPSTVPMTHNYILVETTALLQSRLGIQAVRAFQEGIVPLLQVEWIAEPGHRAAMETMLTADRRKLSLVDCASFAVMRERGITHAFCFDRHFGEQGFQPIP